MKPARDHDPARPCQLDARKWRVHRYVVQVPEKEVVVRPWQLQAPVPASPPTKDVAVWGVWPPEWNIEGAPLLLYWTWRQAFGSAWSRAQFAYSNSPAQQPEEYFTNGQA